MEKTLQTACKFCKRAGVILLQLHPIKGWILKKDLIKHETACRLAHEPEAINNKAKKKLRKDRKKWQKGEERGNALVGAKETMVSGALNKDGDGRIIGQWRVETKVTEKESYRLYERIWNKLIEGAIASNEEPVFYVETKVAKFVLVRDAIADFLEHKREVQVSGKSFCLTTDLALILNYNNGHILSSWSGRPVVMLSRNLNIEGKYES